MKNFSFNIEELMITDIISPSVSQKVSRIISFFSEKRIPFIPVTRDNKYYGVITVWDLAKLGFNKNTKLSSLAWRIPAYGYYELRYEDLVRTIIKNRFPGIVVTDRYEKIIGIVTQSNLLKNNFVLSIFSNRKVGEFTLSGNSYFLSISDKISRLKNYLLRNRIEEVYIVDGRIEGYVTIYDIIEKIYTFYIKRSKRGELVGETFDVLKENVSKIINFKEIIVKSSDYISNILPILSSFSTIPVLNDDKKLIGIVTRYNILKRLSKFYEKRKYPIYIKGLYRETHAFKEVIEKKVYESTYSLSKKARILEVKVIVRSSKKCEGKFLYKVNVNIVLDRGVHSGYAEGWSLLSTCIKAIDNATFSLIKTRKKIKKRKLRRARLQPIQ